MLLFPSEQKQTSKVNRLKFAFNKTHILLKYLSNKDTGVEWYERLLFHWATLWVKAFLFLLQILMSVASHLAKTVASAQIR